MLKRRYLALIVVMVSLFAVPSVAAERYFVGSASSSWSDAANWSDVSGGSGGIGVPGSTGDTAIFDANSPDCTLEVDVTVDALKLETGFTGTVNANGNAININYASGDGCLLIAGGTLKLGSATHTISGDLIYSGGAINAETSTVVLLAPNSASIDVDGDFALGNVTFTHSNSGSSHKTVNLLGTLTVNGNLELDGYNVGGWHFYLNGGGELIAKGDISADGNVIRGTADLTISGDTGDQTQTNLAWGATGTYSVNKSVGKLVFAGTEIFGDSSTSSGCFLTMAIHSEVDAVSLEPVVKLVGYGHGDVFLSGDLTVYDLNLVRPGGTGHSVFDLGEGVLAIENDLAINMSATGGWTASVKNGTLNCKKNVETLNKLETYCDSVTLLLSGTVAQSIDLQGLSFQSVVVENTNAAVTFLGGFSCLESLSAVAGSSLVFEAGETVSANTLSLAGTTADPVLLRSSVDGAAWNINVATRYPTAVCVDVKDADGSEGEKLFAIDSADSGGNTNWVFMDGAHVAISTQASSITSPAWVQGEVGPDVTELSVSVDEGDTFEAIRASRLRWFAENSIESDPFPIESGAALGIVLSEIQATQVQVTAKNDLMNEDTITQSITWTATDLEGSTQETVVKIRKGDSLLLTVVDSEGTGTTIEIDAEGDGTFESSGSPGDKFAHQFDTPGMFFAKGKIDGTEVGSMTVLVIGLEPQGDVFGSIASHVNYQREKAFNITPTSHIASVSFSDSFDEEDASRELVVSVKETTSEGVVLNIKPLERGTFSLYARLGESGPVIACVGVVGFTLTSSASEAMQVEETYGDGSQLVSAALTMSPHVDTVDVVLNTSTSGVTFEDSTIQLWAYSPDFKLSDEEAEDSVGFFEYRMIGPNASTVYCHTVTAYQDGVQVSP
jgi:hypothetical protein